MKNNMTEKIDIVKLIEKNPITHLSKDYQNNLITKIQSTFTKKDQQMFVASFYCFLTYSKSEFVIDLDGIWKWFGFLRKDPAKRLLITSFVEKVDYKIVSLPSQETIKNGRPTEQILMTVNTFKKFCLKAGTNKADEIHDYYIKLEELLQETINEETIELRNQLLLKEGQIILNDVQHKIDLKIEKHNTLVKMMRTKNCVYVGEIKENERIKIGSSKSVDTRDKGLKKDYGNLIFLEIFECDNFRETEESILKDPVIVKHLCKEIIKIGGEKSKEVVQLSDNFNYDQLLTIVKKHIEYGYVNFLTPAQTLEKQKLDLESKKLDHILLMTILSNDKCSAKVQKIIDDTLPIILQNISVNININKEEIKENSRTLNTQETINPNYAVTYNTKVKGRTPKGRKVQKIDPDNLKVVIKVYDSMVYCLRSPENNGFHKCPIQNAIKKNRLYKGVRWNFVEEGEDPNISTVGPTAAQSKPSIRSTILQLNSTKTEILESFYTKDSLAKKLGIGKLKMTKIVLDGTKFNDCYFIEYLKCPQELLNNYKKPINRILPTHSKQIKQINPLTNEIVLFNSLHEIYIKLGFADATIRDAIENKTTLGGSLWEYYKTNKDTDDEDSESDNDSDNSESDNDDDNDIKSVKSEKPKKVNKKMPIKKANKKDSDSESDTESVVSEKPKKDSQESPKEN